MVKSGLRKGLIHMAFKVGETVVYPHHGAALIEAVEMRKIKGEDREYLVLRVAQGDLTVRVPSENVDLVGVRDVVDAAGLERVFSVLRQPYTEEPTNWSRRYKANLEKEIAILRKTGAKLVWCATTPVPNHNKGQYARRKGAAREFNQAALEVMRKHPDILVNDLCQVIDGSPAFDNWRKGSDVHFYREEERKLLGEAVASAGRVDRSVSLVHLHVRPKFLERLLSDSPDLQQILDPVARAVGCARGCVERNGDAEEDGREERRTPARRLLYKIYSVGQKIMRRNGSYSRKSFENANIVDYASATMRNNYIVSRGTMRRLCLLTTQKAFPTHT